MVAAFSFTASTTADAAEWWAYVWAKDTCERATLEPPDQAMEMVPLMITKSGGMVTIINGAPLGGGVLFTAHSDCVMFKGAVRTYRNSEAAE
jgi:hypothetical protein